MKYYVYDKCKICGIKGSFNWYEATKECSFYPELEELDAQKVKQAALHEPANVAKGTRSG